MSKTNRRGGFKAMMDGESDLVFGLQNKLETTIGERYVG
jgi:hypothetical protein